MPIQFPSFTNFSCFLLYLSTVQRGQLELPNTEEHLYHFMAFVEANSTHEVRKIATEPIANVTRGVVNIYDLVHGNINLLVLIFQQTYILFMQKFPKGLGQRSLGRIHIILSTRDLQYLIEKGNGFKKDEKCFKAVRQYDSRELF